MEQGAQYAPHWAFCEIKRPAVPTISGYTPRNPIDAFVRAGVKGLSPSTLNVSVNTIRTHLQRIYEKLHVRSRTKAVVKYLS